MAFILIVEDEYSLASLLAEVLQDAGYSVATALNGEEALSELEKQVPAMVVSDVMMPKMDGLKLLAKIRSNPDWKKIKVVLISAAPIRNTGDVTADKYLQKPYNIDLIEEVVQELLKEEETG